MIIDPATREVIANPPPTEIFERARKKAQPHTVVNELLRAQIETNSKDLPVGCWWLRRCAVIWRTTHVN